MGFLVVLILLLIVLVVFFIIVYMEYKKMTTQAIYYSGFWNYGVTTTPSSPNSSTITPKTNMADYTQSTSPTMLSLLAVGLPDYYYSNQGGGHQWDITIVYDKAELPSVSYLMAGPYWGFTNKTDTKLTGAHWSIKPKFDTSFFKGGSLYNEDLEVYAYPVITGYTYPTDVYNYTIFTPDTQNPPINVGVAIGKTIPTTIPDHRWSYQTKITTTINNTKYSYECPSLQCSIYLKASTSGSYVWVNYFLIPISQLINLPGSFNALSYILGLSIDYQQIINNTNILQPKFPTPNYYNYTLFSASWFWKKNSACDLYSIMSSQQGGGSCTSNSDCPLGTCVNNKCSCTGSSFGYNCQWPTPAAKPDMTDITNPKKKS